jgi:hypothetical protein
MSRTRATLALFALLAFACTSLAGRASAQRTAEAFIEETEHDNALRVTVEMDPALAFGVGYVRAVPIAAGDFSRRLAVHADLTAIMGGSSWDLTGGVSMMLANESRLNVLVTVDLELKLAQNDVHTALVYGYGAALRPGWYDPSWYVALETSLRGTFAASLFHDDAYEAEVPGVRNGTYLTGQLAFYLGGALGVRIARVATLGLRFAWRIPRTLESYAPWFQAYTANLELGWRF